MSDDLANSEPVTLPPPQAEDVVIATEQLRSVEFPEVPQGLLAAVLDAEQGNPDNRAAAVRAIERIVDEHLSGGAANMEHVDSVVDVNLRGTQS
ncbi:hypothetical protein [Amycolatopsis arida]|uniref:hypothetical protein n=1 Tax=Amycolatopsis arida TaxID=587909 RepID=UPI001064DE61|nr:hypothetical protein [Amycolatopsis arida]